MAREAQGASQTRQIALATLQHMGDHHRRLPQLRLDPHGEISESPDDPHFGFLFGGARSIVNIYNASRIGADRRPLNAYLGGFGPDERPEVFLDPLDTGTNDSQLIGFAPDDPSATVYDLVGSSYVLNDHALDSVPCPFVEIFDTLIPPEGGPAPMVETPSRTWLAGQAPIYNYDDEGDKGELWGRDRVRATLAFVDGHVKVALPVPPGPVNTTDDYTFFPRPDWPDRFEHLTARER
jgi:prepilin-type processing-associated H-X9-DG protein